MARFARFAVLGSHLIQWGHWHHPLGPFPAGQEIIEGNPRKGAESRHELVGHQAPRLPLLITALRGAQQLGNCLLGPSARISSSPHAILEQFLVAISHKEILAPIKSDVTGQNGLAF